LVTSSSSSSNSGAAVDPKVVSQTNFPSTVKPNLWSKRGGKSGGGNANKIFVPDMSKEAQEEFDKQAALQRDEILKQRDRDIADGITYA
jgi:hypothetical protein